MPHLYSLKEVAGFLLAENPAIHGVSPEVYIQNQVLVSAMGQAARQASDSLLAVQLMGSRANGTSALTSGVDFATITFDTPQAETDLELLCDTVSGLGLQPHESAAAEIEEIEEVIPPEAQAFIEFVDTDPMAKAGLFEDGIFTKPDLKLARLVALTVFMSCKSNSTLQIIWSNIRWRHATAYLGSLDIMVDNLAERLGSSKRDTVKTINHDLMVARYDKFGLPDDIKQCHASLRSWANSSGPRLRGLVGWQLLKDVRKELKTGS